MEGETCCRGYVQPMMRNNSFVCTCILGRKLWKTRYACACETVISRYIMVHSSYLILIAPDVYRKRTTIPGNTGPIRSRRHAPTHISHLTAFDATIAFTRRSQELYT